MIVDVSAVGPEAQTPLVNMVKLYCHEWSAYNGIDMDERGEFEFERQVPKFFGKERHYAFFIRVEGRLAGFALVDDDFDFAADADHAVSEFFVLNKYRRLGVGGIAAKEVFRRLPGKWEIKTHPANTASIAFWESVVRETAGSSYRKIEACGAARYADGSLGTIFTFAT